MTAIPQMFARESNKMEEKEVIIEGASRLRIQYLIDHPEAHSFVLRRLILGKDGHTSMHSHDYEHGFYILSGKGEVTDGKLSLPLKKNVVAFVPAHLKHQVRNIGRGRLMFLSVEPA